MRSFTLSEVEGWTNRLKNGMNEGLSIIYIYHEEKSEHNKKPEKVYSVRKSADSAGCFRYRRAVAAYSGHVSKARVTKQEHT